MKFWLALIGLSFALSGASYVHFRMHREESMRTHQRADAARSLGGDHRAGDEDRPVRVGSTM